MAALVKKRARPGWGELDRNGLKKLTGCPAGPFSIKGLHKKPAGTEVGADHAESAFGGQQLRSCSSLGSACCQPWSGGLRGAGGVSEAGWPLLKPWDRAQCFILSLTNKRPTWTIWFCNIWETQISIVDDQNISLLNLKAFDYHEEFE